VTGAVPDGWFSEPPEVVVDVTRYHLGRVAGADVADDPTEARSGRGAGRPDQPVREDTREDRIRVARQIEHRYQRKVACGVRCGDTSELYTHLAAPVMTRLRQPERQILDRWSTPRGTVPLGGARLVREAGRATHEDGSPTCARAMTKVDELRRQGPDYRLTES